MVGELVIVEYEDAGRIAKIEGECDNMLTVRLMRPKASDNCTVYKYSNTTVEVDKKSVTLWYETSDEAELGFTREGDRFIDYSSDDEEYEPSTSEESDSESVSLDEENFSDDL